MRKDATPGAKLYYGQVRSLGKITFNKLCEKVAKLSTASKGDVEVVISSLLSTLTEYLEIGFSIQVGELGNFRMTAGCTGCETEKDFNTFLFKKPRIIFSPGTLLRNLTAEMTFDKMAIKEVECDKTHID